jgi:hypothetical protein
VVISSANNQPQHGRKSQWSDASLGIEATIGRPSKGFDAMARRRFQSPKPFKEGQFWWLRVWDTNLASSRKRQRILASSSWR